MRTITIHEETSTAEDMAEVLDRVAELLREGYTMGYEPSWELEGDDEEEEEEEDTDTADTLRDQGKTILDEIAEHYTRHVSQATQDDAAQRQRLNDAADQFCREDIARAELRDEITAEQAEELRDQIHDHAGNLQP